MNILHSSNYPKNKFIEFCKVAYLLISFNRIAYYFELSIMLVINNNTIHPRVFIDYKFLSKPN